MSGSFIATVAARFPSRIAAAAALYGIGIVTDKPDSPHLLLDRVKGELYFAFAEIDPGVPAQAIKDLDVALKRTKLRHTVKIIPGTHHGYQFAARADYEPVAAEATWDELFSLWERTLR
jgi:carboxymethylenebutenolidase